MRRWLAWADGLGRERARIGRLSTGDRRAVAVLLGIPALVFVVPAVFGYPALAGDNLIQNFPLRALSGDLIRHGQLPLWNPAIWSGSPLLGGLNAGSLYPGTLVFVVLPAVAAWIVNMVAAYWAGAIGLYVLMRQLRLSSSASCLAAATYAFSGAMTGQLVHLPIVQGMAWVPWVILAQVRLSWAVLGVGPAGEPRPGTSAWPWVALLAAALGLVCLTGEPRGIAEVEVVATVVTLWTALKRYRVAVGRSRRAAYVGWSVLGAGWGVTLALVQLLPGWSFINVSQRSSGSYTFFGAGSLHTQWSALLLVPDLFGGSGVLHQPSYFNSYNLVEVTGYVGLLPLVAAFTLATRAFGRHRDRRAGEWGLFMALAVLGLLLSFGSYTPLGHLFVHIPLFGRTRLQSRSLGIVDLGLAVLLGFWLDGLVRRRSRAAWGWRRWVGAAPALAAAALCVTAIALPGPVEAAFDIGGGANATLGRDLTPWFVAQLVVAVAAVAVALDRPRLSLTTMRRSIGVVVAIDLALFSVSTVTGIAAGYRTVQPARADAVAALGTRGRFAIYDTAYFNFHDLVDIGQPDLNTFTGLASVQGYGAIVGGRYADVTGAHDFDDLDPCALARGVFDPLRLATLLTVPSALATETLPGEPAQAPVPSVGVSAAQCPGAPPPGSAASRALYLGQPLVISTVSVNLLRPAGHANRPAPRVGIIGVGGSTRYPEMSHRLTAHGWMFRLLHPRSGIGVVVEGAGGRVADTSSVYASVLTEPGAGASVNQRLPNGEAKPTSGTYVFDGVLQDALDGPAWRFDGVWRTFIRFDHVGLRPAVWLAGSPGGDARVRLVSQSRNGTAVVSVSSPTPVVVVRSEAFESGWHVAAVPDGGGPARALPVRADGLLQSVRVPAGRFVLTFRYRPKGLTLGMVGSGTGLVAFVALGAVAWRRRKVQR